jgi:soluble lytic murein transglycosylase-like protein
VLQTGVTRRNGLQKIAAGLALLGWAHDVLAGSQLEEPLSDAVRSALSAALRAGPPPIPEFAYPSDQQRYQRWLEAMQARLVKKFPRAQGRQEFLQTVWYESQRAGLDVSLVLGVIQVESNFRKFAVSRAGALGYMQVMPFWVRELSGADPSVLFHLQTNVRFGCVILRHYLDREQGDWVLALGRYNGSRGKLPYPQAVLAAQRQWQWK